jgi:hypothetical protein
MDLFADWVMYGAETLSGTRWSATLAEAERLCLYLSPILVYSLPHSPSLRACAAGKFLSIYNRRPRRVLCALLP